MSRSHCLAPAGGPPPAIPTLPRRGFIRLLGGGAVLAAGGAAGCSSAFPEGVTQPWQDAASPSETRRFMLAHALLAPPGPPDPDRPRAFAAHRGLPMRLEPMPQGGESVCHCMEQGNYCMNAI